MVGQDTLPADDAASATTGTDSELPRRVGPAFCGMVAAAGTLAFLLLELQRDVVLRLVFEKSDAAYINLYSNALLDPGVTNRWNTPPASSVVPDVLIGMLLHGTGVDGRSFTYGFVVAAAAVLLAALWVLFAGVGTRSPLGLAGGVTAAALLGARYPQFGLTYLFVPGHHGLQFSLVVLGWGLGLLALRRRSGPAAVWCAVGSTAVSLAAVVSDPLYAPAAAVAPLVLGAAYVVRAPAPLERRDVQRVAAVALVLAALPLVAFFVVRSRASRLVAKYQAVDWERGRENLRALLRLTPTDNLDVVALLVMVVVMVALVARVVVLARQEAVAAGAGGRTGAAGVARTLLRDNRAVVAVLGTAAAVVAISGGVLMALNGRYVVAVPLVVLVLVALTRPQVGADAFLLGLCALGLLLGTVAALHLEGTAPADPAVACVEKAMTDRGQDTAVGTYWTAKRLTALLPGIFVAQVDNEGASWDWIDARQPRVPARLVVADNRGQLDYLLSQRIKARLVEVVDCGGPVVGVLDRTIRR